MYDSIVRRILLVPGILLPFGMVGRIDAADVHVIDSAMHHLRNAEPREWSRFPEKAEATRLVSRFDLETPGVFRVISLRQEETKQVWEVLLNGEKIGSLPRDHNHLEHALSIPETLLREAGNELVIETKSETPDDIRVGDIVLHPEGGSPSEPARAEELRQKRGYDRVLPDMGTTVELEAIEEETGEAIPCRFTIIDAETGALALVGAESNDRIAVREGVVYSLDGKATFGLAGSANSPRTYRIFCGRGFEYGLGEQTLRIDGSDPDPSLKFTLVREVPTPGWVACDPHLHTFEYDRHGDCDLAERLISCAGEGVELPVSTAHDRHVSYEQEAVRIGADRWMTPVTGCEVTTSLGHFNIFPVDPAVPPVEHKLRPWARIFEGIFATPNVRVCILNHGRDEHRGFTPLSPENFDAETGRFLQGRVLRANGMELINSGAQQTDPMRLVLDWYALLRSGHEIAGIGSSDSHTVNFAIPGQARTYLPVADEQPSAIDTKAAIDALLAGRGAVSFGLFTTLEREGDELVCRVLGPSWTAHTELTIYRNGEVAKVWRSDPIRTAGEKRIARIPLDDLGAVPGDLLGAVATGPGITEGWWAIMPPYKPDSPDFDPFVMGISPVVWVE